MNPGIAIPFNSKRGNRCPFYLKYINVKLLFYFAHPVTLAVESASVGVT